MSRPNKPTALKIIEGNRGKRALGKQEPDPDYLDDLLPPAWMPEAAKKVWSEFAFKLRKAKVLTVIDVPAFEKFCVAHSRWRAAVVDLAVRGVMVDRAEIVAAKTDAKDAKPTAKSDAKSAVKPGPSQVINQLVFAESMFFKQALAIERELGMTPAARTRVMIEPQLTLFPDAGHENEKKEKAGSEYFTK